MIDKYPKYNKYIIQNKSEYYDEQTKYRKLYTFRHMWILQMTTSPAMKSPCFKVKSISFEMKINGKNMKLRWPNKRKTNKCSDNNNSNGNNNKQLLSAEGIIQLIISQHDSLGQIYSTLVVYETSSHVITPSCVTHQSPQPWCKVGIVSLCTTEPTLLEVIKWVSKGHYAHIQLDDEVTSNIVFWAMKSRTGSVDAYPIPCNPQFQLQQTYHSQDLWHQVELLRYRVNHSIFYTSH